MLAVLGHGPVRRPACWSRARGCRALGFIGADEERSRQRLEDFRAEAARVGLGEVPAELMRPPVQADHAALQLAQRTARRADLDAVFCSDDLLAVGVLFACQRRDIEVPRRLAVMGFGDLPIARAASPQLATIRVRRAEMGERAGQMLLARLAGQDPGPGRSTSASRWWRGPAREARARGGSGATLA